MNVKLTLKKSGSTLVFNELKDITVSIPFCNSRARKYIENRIRTDATGIEQFGYIPAGYELVRWSLL